MELFIQSYKTNYDIDRTVQKSHHRVVKAKNVVLSILFVAIALGLGFLSVDYLLKKDSKVSNKSNDDSTQKIIENKELIGTQAADPLLPLKDKLVSLTEFSEFSKDLLTSGLYEQLNSEGTYTVLGIQNEKYLDLKKKSENSANSNEKLSKILKNHILKGSYTVENFGLNLFLDQNQGDVVKVRTLNDDVLELKRSTNSNTVLINNISVDLVKDNFTRNGNILEVNQLLVL